MDECHLPEDRSSEGMYLEKVGVATAKVERRYIVYEIGELHDQNQWLMSRDETFG